MKETLTYDVSDFDDIDDSNSFSKEIIASFLVELESLIPALQNILVSKDCNLLFQAIHKVLPTIHVLKIKQIVKDVDYINSLKEQAWNVELENKTNNILEHLKVVEAEMKEAF